jgi:hypothetical protein
MARGIVSLTAIRTRPKRRGTALPASSAGASGGSAGPGGRGGEVGVDDPGQAGDAVNVFRDGHRDHARHIDGSGKRSGRASVRTTPLFDRASGRWILHSSFAFIASARAEQGGGIQSLAILRCCAA